jgi:hypothetical protein
MDPYWEGYLWPDLHTALANRLRQQLAPLLRPNYTARLGLYIVEDTTPEADLGVMYPDVEVLLSGARSLPGAQSPSAAVTPPRP